MRSLSQGIILWLVLALAQSILIAQDSSDREQQRVETKQALDKLRNDIKTLQNDQSRNRSKLSIQQTALKEADIAINQSNQRLRTTRRSLSETRQSIKQLNRRESLLSADKTSQQKALAQQIRAAYINGNQEYLKISLIMQNLDLNLCLH